MSAHGPSGPNPNDESQGRAPRQGASTPGTPGDEALQDLEPGPEADVLSDSSLEELDLESLIGNDPPGTGAGKDPSSTGAETREAEIKDDGEIELLDDEPIILLDGPGEAALGLASGATNGSADSSQAQGSQESQGDTIQETGQERSVPRKGGETKVAKEKPKNIKPIKSKGEKPAGKLAPKSAQKSAHKVGASSKEPARAAPSVSLRGSVAFVCSECYEEFLLPANYSQEMVCCPECLHVGKRPDADFLRTVNRHKSGERSATAIAIAAGLVVTGLILAVLWLSSDMALAASGGKADSGLVTILAGVAALLAMIFLWLTVRAEGNRWEVYF